MLLLYLIKIQTDYYKRIKNKKIKRINKGEVYEKV